MRIVIIAPGSRGDVQPYIALGKGLKNAGHIVRFISHQNFEPLVAEHGLEFWAVSSDVQGIVEKEEMQNRIEDGNFLFLMVQMAKEAQREALRFTEVGLSACQGMEFILAGMGGLFVGYALAEKLKLPFIQAYVVPFTPTRAFPSVLAPKMPVWLGDKFNHLSHQITRQILWQGFRSADSTARKKVLDLPGAPFFGPYNSQQTHGMPILYGISPSVIMTPSDDWNDDDIHITGYWFLDESEDWAPPPALMDFLDSGPPPVYVGFGSMSNRKPEEMADLVIKALKQTNQRAILLSGWGGLKKADLPESIFMVNAVPHSWLFPRVSAVVHHGGASTTAAGLKAGIPSIIIPFFGDQPFWGRRVAELGVGPYPIPRKKLKVENLADSIRETLLNQEMRQRAADLGARIQAEEGISKVVEIINRFEKGR